MANKITFASNINIGQNGAENDDEFLFKCFIDHHALSELTDMNNPSNFVLGSTGSGKTALLRMIEKNKENCESFEVHEMAMNHIANSDVIQFLQSIDVDLSIFFQALWRHVICIEYIKQVTQADTKDKFRYIKTKIVDFIKRESVRDKMIKFIEDNENRFWNTVDENIIEITEALEKNLTATMGGEVEKFTLRAGYARGLSGEKKVQLQQRAKKFVDGNTIAELGHVIGALAEYTKGRADEYFILIDRLDEAWVDESIKYQLIQSLFEALKGLQKLRNLKVIVALRNDVYERMIREAPPSRAQLEKYNDYIVRLRWTKEQLWQLAERRVNHLFKWKYSSENVHFVDIFKQKIDTRLTVWNYLLERTLLRPRDVINFVNETLQKSEGKSSVSKKDFLNGEHTYSDLRLESLRYEWHGTYTGIGVMLDSLRNKPSYFGVSEFATSRFVDHLWVEIGKDLDGQKDDIWLSINKSVEDSATIEPLSCCQGMFSRLHLIGAVGLKLSSSASWQWFHETGKPVSNHQIGMDTKVRIHPMLSFALGVSERRASEKD
ncbi:P-loop ATPase, Sll1717 family [Falsihalocynthiibacter arcticus]|uniref:DNA repair ATPase n=1 Tax=Falsihalocynthiibacter arcticus TaxID=1579316 RepID=A0A126V4E9_9RHOB|nr:hypothetical protein [Falsihalocynthiibacter arcticus]AML52746.1 hypothetical protein RC74_17095 [Falsihalocynthiibacter arcticus]